MPLDEPFDIAAHLRLQFDSTTMRPTQPVTVDVRELELACQEIEVLRELVYCYPPNPPFAPEGETWKQCAEQLYTKLQECRNAIPSNNTLYDIPAWKIRSGT
jgi:hypothetical protein